MPGNSFGQLFKITTFGESHGGAVGVVIDGCPPGFKIDEKYIQKELNRRRPGQSIITSSRKEADEIMIISGIFKGRTTGTPIMLLAFNKDVKSEDYIHLKNLYRPSHADYAYEMKYGLRDWRGGGRSSNRETLARVAAGAIAKKYLKEKLKIEILGWVDQVGDIKAEVNMDKVSMKSIESNIIRCPDQKAAEKMIALVNSIKEEGDSMGGIIKGVIKGVPVGLGEPVFDKLHADLGKAMLSIGAVKGFEIGTGFSSVGMKGSEHNDSIYLDSNRNIRTRTNNSGGVLGGISNGELIYFKVVFKPVSTITKSQLTIDKNKKEITLEAKGRHDPCVLPRAVSIVDAMSALVIMDHYLRQKAQNM